MQCEVPKCFNTAENQEKKIRPTRGMFTMPPRKGSMNIITSAEVGGMLRPFKNDLRLLMVEIFTLLKA